LSRDGRPALESPGAEGYPKVMQLGAVLVYDAGPMSLRHGGIDVERVRAWLAKRLPELPRARERRVRLALGSLEGFVPDAGFQLDYHVRHTCLPRPGDERALKRLTGRIFSQALDPERPLWELWLVEGLEDGRFALVAKCDSALLEPEARAAGGWLHAGEARARRALAALLPRALAARAGGGLRGALDLAEDALFRAGALSAGNEGPHRRIDWLALAADDVAAIRERLGGSERDVVLAALTGGLRRTLERRAAAADLGAMRAVTPFCVGDRSFAPRLRLPLDAHDARARLVALRAQSEGFAPRGGATHESPLHELWALWQAGSTRRAELLALELQGLSAAAFLGAKLQAFVPVAPALAGRALGVTTSRLGKRLFVTLDSDAARLPDLAPLADAVAASFDELRRLAAEPPAQAPRARRARAPRRRATKSLEAEA